MQERRENAEKKKAADQGSEPDNRITQNALPEETPIVASPPVYQDIYSRVPMLPMLPLPVFYNNAAEEGSGGPEDDSEVAEFQPGPNQMGYQPGANQMGYYPYPDGPDQPEEGDEKAGLIGNEEGSLAYAEVESGDEANDIYEDAKSIEQGEDEKNGFYGDEKEAANINDMASADEATQRQDTGADAGAQPAGAQPPGAQPPAGGAGQQGAAGQAAGQQPSQPPAGKPGEEGKGEMMKDFSRA